MDDNYVVSPDGNVYQVPNAAMHEAINSGGKPATVMADHEGNPRYVPNDAVSDAIKWGGKVLSTPIIPGAPYASQYWGGLQQDQAAKSSEADSALGAVGHAAASTGAGVMRYIAGAGGMSLPDAGVITAGAVAPPLAPAASAYFLTKGTAGLAGIGKESSLKKVIQHPTPDNVFEAGNDALMVAGPAMHYASDLLPFKTITTANDLGAKQLQGATMVAEDMGKGVRQVKLVSRDGGQLGEVRTEPVEGGGVKVQHAEVVKHLQGRGAGKMLYEHAIEDARSQGAQFIVAGPEKSQNAHFAWEGLKRDGLPVQSYAGDTGTTHWVHFDNMPQETVAGTGPGAMLAKDSTLTMRDGPMTGAPDDLMAQVNQIARNASTNPNTGKMEKANSFETSYGKSPNVSAQKEAEIADWLRNNRDRITKGTTDKWKDFEAKAEPAISEENAERTDTGLNFEGEHYDFDRPAAPWEPTLVKPEIAEVRKLLPQMEELIKANPELGAKVAYRYAGVKDFDVNDAEHLRYAATRLAEEYLKNQRVLKSAKDVLGGG